MDNKFNKWIKHLEIIKSEISELLISQNIFWEINNIIKENPNLNKPSAFWNYFGNTYVASVAIAVRRQIKNKPNSISFTQLLEDMKGHPQSFPRSYYHEIYKGSLAEQWVDKDFNRFAKPSQNHICPDMISADIVKLKQIVKKCEDFADKVVAHSDKRKPKILPTFNELDNCIKFLDELYVKYHLLFHAQSMDTLMPTYQYDWTEIFKYPWILENLDH